VLQRWSA